MSYLIHARVSPRLLEKVDRRFTNRIDDLFIELFQNARRAGATHINITTRELDPTDATDGLKTEITIEDNGSGIADFSPLLGLGESEWDGNVAEREDAAGEGFFSLVHSGVEVTSLNHRAIFTKENFLGRFPVEVLDMEVSYPGTRLVFRRREDQATIESAAGRVARYGHTPCSMNGVTLPQEDFLEGAKYIKVVSGVRIGIFDDGDRWERWNFHGRALRSSSPSLTDVAVDQRGQSISLYTRLDVLETQAIWLTHPDRSAPVEDEKYHAMMREATVTLYEYLATLPSHRASFTLYKEAHDLGVDLREASPWFNTFTVPPADADVSPNSFLEHEKLMLADPTASAIVEFLPETENYAFTFAAAAENFKKLGIQPLEDDESRYRGYSWYSGMQRLHSFSLTIDGVEATDGVSGDPLRVVEAIELSFLLNRVEDPICWDLPFACWLDEEYDGDSMRMCVTKTSAWAHRKSHQPFDLIDAAIHVAFFSSDSADSDSWDTQEQYFRDEWESEFLRVLGGSEAVIEAELLKALGGWPLSSRLRDASISNVHLIRKPRDDGWAVILTKAA